MKMAPKSFRLTDKVSVFFARSLICFFQAGSLKSYGVLVEDLTRQTRMSFAMTGLILPLQHSLSYFLAPVVAAIMYRIGPRATVMLGGLLTGLGYIGNGILPLKPTFLITFCTCTGFGYALAQLPTYLHLRKVFQEDGSFCIVQSLADQFMFVGISVLPLVFEKFQEMYGLQGALFLFGGLNLHNMIAGIIMTSYATLTESENDDSSKKESKISVSTDYHIKMSLKLQDGDNASEGALTAQEPSNEKTSTDKSRDQPDVNSNGESYSLHSYYDVLQRNMSLIFLIMSGFTNSFISFGWILFLIPLGKEKGLSSSLAVLLSTVAGVGALFGRMWCIILSWKGVKIPFCYFGLPAFLQCLAFTCLSLTANNLSALLTISFLSGMPFGATGAAVGGVCALKVSRFDFQAAIVLVLVFNSLGTEMGGGVCGAVYDYTGSTIPVFLLLATSNIILVLISAVWSLWERFDSKSLTK